MNNVRVERRAFLKGTTGMLAGLVGAGLVASESHGADAPAKKDTADAKKSGEGEWTPLFNGKDLAGWAPEGGAVWTVEDGCLVGKQGPKGAPGDLFTVKEYGDFELTVTYKIQWPANSGIWFRYQDPKKAYQADILEFKNPEAYSGTIYCPAKMFLAVNKDPKLEKRDGWNTMKVNAKGDHLIVTLNDVVTGDVHEASYPKGKIGFQVHPGEEFKSMKITVKEIRIKTVTA
ncbi:MAG: DUF1080 domain-containing protein [Candidatus Hydrogenedentes bacterium]|nr:DUF1080 domain-containing protein [Candidatus Hydrogenedentota bacterium]